MAGQYDNELLIFNLPLQGKEQKEKSWHPTGELTLQDLAAGRNLDAITWYHKNIAPNEYYLVTDKVNSKINLCRAGQVLATYNTRMGRYAADDDVMTTTYADENGNVRNMLGDQTAPAGLFFLSHIDTYYGEPSYMSLTKEQLESGNGKGIPNLIHYYPNLETEGTSNGCFRVSKESIEHLSKYIGDKLIRHYILPVNEENYFYIRGREIQFNAGAVYDEDVFSVVDPEKKLRNKEEAKVPYTLNLVSLPLKIEWDEKKFNRDLKKVIKLFVASLENNKDQLAKDLGVNTDTYDYLAKYALGILGLESSYGKDDWWPIDILKTIRYKAGYNSRPDYKRKQDLFDLYDFFHPNVSEEEKAKRSVGLTLIRMAYLSDAERKLFDKYDISEKDLIDDPQKAAIATMIKLAHAYRPNQDIDAAIRSWNNKAPKYVQHVKEKAAFFLPITYYAKGGKIEDVFRSVAFEVLKDIRS